MLLVHCIEVPRGYCTRQGVVSTTIQTTDAWGVIRQASATTAINETKKTNLPTLQLSPMMVAEETVTISKGLISLVG